MLVAGTISIEDLAHELAALQPDEVGSAADFGIPPSLPAKHSSPVLVAWWD